MPEASLEKRPIPEADSPLGLSKRQKVGLALGATAAALGMALWDFLGSWTPEQWSGSAAVATVVVALVAAFVGLRQLREAQTLRLQQERDAHAVRREQAQPYVAVFMEPLVEVDPRFQELVIKNFGATAAFSIESRASRRSRESGTERLRRSPCL